MSDDDEDELMEKIDLEQVARLVDGLNAAPPLSPGQVVCWRKGYLTVGLDEPHVVLDILEAPAFHTQTDVTSFQFREPLTVQVGRFQDNGSLHVFHVDGRRFQPARGERGRSFVAKALREAYDTLGRPQSFQPGQILRWKPGMSNKLANGPFIMVEPIAPPMIDTESAASSSYFRERLDLFLGHVDDDGDFIVFTYDSRRLEAVGPWGDEAETQAAERLRQALDQFNRRLPLQPGQLVRWKPGMQNRSPGGPFIVIEELPPRRDDKAKCFDPTAHDMIDIRLGRLSDENELLIHCYDSRRLEPVPEAELPGYGQTAARLRELWSRFATKHAFLPGQFVRCKKGIVLPGQDETLVVVELLPEPIFDPLLSSMHNRHREPLDLIAARIDEDGDFVLNHYDRRLLEPVD